MGAILRRSLPPEGLTALADAELDDLESRINEREAKKLEVQADSMLALGRDAYAEALLDMALVMTGYLRYFGSVLDGERATRLGRKMNEHIDALVDAVPAVCVAKPVRRNRAV